MEYISLRNTDLQVSRLCMGGCPMGQYGWGRVCEQELMAAVHTALDCGVNFFDTADTYGLGASERTLGKALAGRRDRAVIATKFGVRVTDSGTVYDNSPEWIRLACEQSLKRLGTDYIDLYQIHYRDGKTDIHCVVDALKLLQQQGKIRWFGISNVKPEGLDELESCRGSFAAVQNQFSLACRDQESIIRHCSGQLEMTPMTWGSLGQGVLTGKYDRNASFGSDDRRSRRVYVNFHGEKLDHNLRIVEVLRQIARDRDKPVSAVAVRFILDYLPDSVVLCGAKRPEQMQDNARSLLWNLTREELRQLDEISRNQS